MVDAFFLFFLGLTTLQMVQTIVNTGSLPPFIHLLRITTKAPSSGEVFFTEPLTPSEGEEMVMSMAVALGGS